MSLSSRFKKLPVGARRQLSLGIIVALFLALPLFVWGITSQKFLINQNAQEGPTNACGGTCGSIYNCNVNLFCYQGFCRNPDCPNDATCGCIATLTPIPTVSPTRKPTPTPTPEIVVLTPTPTETPTPQATEVPVLITEATPTPQSSGNITGAAIFIAADLLVIIIILVLLRKK